jgi:hypothetical protein
LRADGVHTAENDVVDSEGIDAIARHEVREHVCPEIGGVLLGETAVLSSDGGPDRIDDESFGHG